MFQMPMTLRLRASSSIAGLRSRARTRRSFLALTKPSATVFVTAFLKKKLGLQESDSDLDKAIKDVCEKMKAERDKPRVTFYYLLAEKYGKLGMFH
jgi:hypothetical protein